MIRRHSDPGRQIPDDCGRRRVPHGPIVYRSTERPIAKADANTRAVFGDYISIYDIQGWGILVRVPPVRVR